MRTKDRPWYVRRALASITSQTFADWELVVVNDGGDLETLQAFITELPERDSTRVRMVSHPHSLGRWPSANAGVRAGSGEFVILHDDDDTWEPGFLEAAVAYLDLNPERLAVVSRVRIVWEKRTGADFEVLRTETFLPDAIAPLLMDQVAYNRFVPIALLYRRTVHELTGPYDDDYPVVADWRFNTRLLALGPLEYLPGGPLVNWHQRPDTRGADGNSVIAEADDHALADALIRDEAFRASFARDPGLVLYLERRLRKVEELVKHEGHLTRVTLRNPFLDRVRSIARRLRRRG